MNPSDTARRDILRISGFGLSVAAVTGAPAFAALGTTPSAASSVTRAPFDVLDYGAVGDGRTFDTSAVNRAIEACAAAGGGTVVFPAGTYLCFSIRLKSLVHLYLAQGAVILAADSPAPGQTTGINGGAYDTAESNGAFDPYQDYGHNHWHNSLLWGEGLHDLSITGPGLIWGEGLSHGRGVRYGLGIPFIAEQAGVGNKTIALKNCRNVLLTDFSVLKGGHFCILLTGVDNLTINNLRIDTDRDGMDIDCCKNVRISNCTVNSPWDDAICLKSSFALGYARATENVTITNCCVSGCYDLGTVIDGTFKRITDPTYAPFTGRIKFGTESNGGFKNIVISNSIFEGCQGLALESVDGALLEDIAISNITMRDITSCPIFLRLGARLRGPKETTKIGTLRRVLINNLVAYNTASILSSIVSGIPGYEVEDLKFSNIYIQHHGGAGLDGATIDVPEDVEKYPEPDMFGQMPAHGFFFRHARRVEMSHLEIEPAAPDPRPAFYLQSVERADFFAVTAPASPQRPAFALHNVKDFRVLWSRAAKDTAIASAVAQNH